MTPSFEGKPVYKPDMVSSLIADPPPASPSLLPIQTTLVMLKIIFGRRNKRKKVHQ